MRPTMDTISSRLQQSDEQHVSFANERGAQDRVWRDPISPSGFYQVHLGNQSTGGTPIRIQVHAVWDKGNLTTGMGWAIRDASNQIWRKHGCFSYASSAVAASSMACLKAVNWAQMAGFTHISITTSSTELIRALQSSAHQDINIKWTIEAVRTDAASFTIFQVIRVCTSQITEAQQVALWCREHKMDFGWKPSGVYFSFWFSMLLSLLCLCLVCSLVFFVRFSVVKKKKSIRILDMNKTRIH